MKEAVEGRLHLQTYDVEHVHGYRRQGSRKELTSLRPSVNKEMLEMTGKDTGYYARPASNVDMRSQKMFLNIMQIYDFDEAENVCTRSKPSVMQ